MSNSPGMDERSGTIARRFERPLLVAALLVVPVLILEAASPGQPWDGLALALNYAIWAAFLMELVVMLAVVPNRRAWLRDHPLDVAIVVLTPPFLSSALSSVRLLRLLRLVRLFRVAQVARRSPAIEGVRYAAVLALLTVVGGGAAFASLENGKSFTDGLYWSVSTMTTVGYGDVSPDTSGGRALAVAVMLVGIGFVAVLTASIAQRFLAAEVRQDTGEVEEALEMAEEEVLREIRDLAVRLQRLELSVTRLRRS